MDLHLLEQEWRVMKMSGAMLLSEQAETVGIVHHGEEKVLGRPYSSLTVLKVGLEEKIGGDSLLGSDVIGQGVSAYVREVGTTSSPFQTKAFYNSTILWQKNLNQS